MPKVVVLLAFPGVQVLDVTGPHEVFAMANRDGPRYDLHVASLAGGPVRSSHGLVLGTQPLQECPPAPDLLLLPGGEGVHAAKQDSGLLRALRERVTSADRVVSVCTGAFLLGALGLLDGKRVTTHWASLDRLRAEYPLARVEADPIFLQDGRVWTSAGVTAGIDLALALVRADHGPGVALDVARRLVVFVQRPGGQAQFSAQLQAQGSDHGPLDALLAWLADHLHEEVTLAAMARRAGMSERNFARVFRRRLGETPARFVEGLRVDAARRALQDPELPVAKIAERCGFGSVETLERSFRRRLGTTPSAFRRHFSPGAPNA